ncbi:putative protein YqgN [bioreactor metagenome]|uniref:5-formyltetrahydrofolate cyclo-ligase n=1 Tax=bioreactor metagenome TaxID=1076179 RepID=A0A645BQ98_9ZZZZ
MQIDENIAFEKYALRKHLKNLRNQFSCSEKLVADQKIFDQVVRLELITEKTEVFIYVSTAFEVDTHRLITYFLSKGHLVAVPCCIDHHGTMYFYYIKSLSDLQVNHFGILEPDINNSVLAIPKDDDICLVPCLGFDDNGYRIGYGKGYYDRYLFEHQVIKIGLCYDLCRVSKIPKDQYDVRLDQIVTDIINCND